MMRTWEVRWFLEADELGGRLFGASALSGAATRRDWYAPPGSAATGVKLREGALEPKLKLTDGGIQAFGPARGKVEQWQKWSLAFPDGDAPEETVLRATGWVPVDKRRFLRHYRRRDGGVEAMSGAPEVEGEGQVEWTEVTVNGRRAWTLGFETWAADDGVGMLHAMAAAVFGSAQVPEALTPERSLSYPAWLLQRTG